MRFTQLTSDRHPWIESLSFEQSVVCALLVTRRDVKACQRQAMLSRLVTTAGVDEYLPKFLAQSYVTRRAVNRPLERLDCAIDHSIFHQQVSVYNRTLWISLGRIISRHY